MPKSAPDFTLEYMRQTDVIAIISKLGGSKSTDKINVKQRIRAARIKGFLKKNKKRNGRWWVNTKEFFDWAARQKGWELIRSIPGFSSSVIADVQGVSATSTAGNVFHSELEARVFLLEAELRECNAELEKYRQRSRKAQESGRLGGIKQKVF